MSDFAEVTILQEGKELISLKANVEVPPGIVGGSIICRDQFGNAAVAIHGGNDNPAVGGGRLGLLNGPLFLFNPTGSFRVTIAAGDELENEDGGLIVLDAADDLQEPGPLGSHSAIFISAAKRSIVIHGPSGNATAELGPNGNLRLGGGETAGSLILRDSSGKERIKLQAGESNLKILAPDGKVIAELGTNGDLALGGGGKDGDLHLRSGSGSPRIILGADEMQFVIKNDTEDLVVIGGSAGEIFIKGNLRRQRITERSRKIDQDQTHDLFTVKQHGSYIVELSAGYSFADGGNSYIGFSYHRWKVFTLPDVPKPFTSIPLEAQVTSNFWEGVGPEFIQSGANVRLKIPKRAAVGFKVPNNIDDGTLSVRALYGSLLNF